MGTSADAISQQHRGIVPPARVGDTVLAAWIVPLALAYGFLVSPLLGFSPTDGSELGGNINVSTAEGSTSNKLVWAVLAGLAVFSWTKRRKDAVPAAGLPIILLIAYLLLALASIAWSDVPLIGLRRALQQALLFVCMLVPFAVAPSLDGIIEKVCWAFTAVLIVNAAALPLMGIPDFGYRGIYGQKNLMGQVAATAFYFSLYGSLRYSGARRWLFGAMSLTAIALCLASHSKTSQGLLVLVPLAAAGIVGVTTLRSALTRVTTTVFCLLLIALLFAIAIVIPVGISDISTALFHDTTFTGRTMIWEFAGHHIDQAPLLGYGYGSFWGAGQATRAIGEGFIAGILQAHNGYVDVVLETGYLGLALVTTLLFALLAATLRLARSNALRAWLLMTCLLFVLLNNTMESSLFRSYVPLWIVFLFCCGAAGFVPARARAAAGLAQHPAGDRPLPPRGA